MIQRKDPNIVFLSKTKLNSRQLTKIKYRKRMNDIDLEANG